MSEQQSSTCISRFFHPTKVPVHSNNATIIDVDSDHSEQDTTDDEDHLQRNNSIFVRVPSKSSPSEENATLPCDDTIDAIIDLTDIETPRKPESSSLGTITMGQGQSKQGIDTKWDDTNNAIENSTSALSEDFNSLPQTPVVAPIQDAVEDDDVSSSVPAARPVTLPDDETDKLSECPRKIMDDAEKVAESTSLDSAEQALTERTPVNPFASFALGFGSVEDSFFTPAGTIIDVESRKDKLASSNRSKKLSFNVPSPSSKVEKRKGTQKGSSGTAKRIRLPDQKKSSVSSKCNFIPMKDLSLEEQQRIQQKWQSLSDPKAELEVRRFQVLVGARLHARAQEPVVRAALQKLRTFFLPGELCVESLSRANPDNVAETISSVLFCNAKAQQIVQAAKDIRSMFHGQVPESQKMLQRITGIGPMLSDILAFCNKRSAYQEMFAPDPVEDRHEPGDK